MTIGSGSIAFTGLNGQGSDTLAFVLTEDFTAGTSVSLTTMFPTVSGGFSGVGAGPLLNWTATSDMAAGTIVILSDLQLNAAGATASAGSLDFVRPFPGTSGISNGAPAVTAFVGAETSPTFVAHVTAQFISEAVIDNYAKVGIIFGTNALSLPLEDELGAYVGPREGLADVRDFLALINDPDNWVSQGSSANSPSDGLPPDLPFSSTAFTIDPNAQSVSLANIALVRTITEGDSGVTTLTFTVERHGTTNTGAIDFTAELVALGTDAADFGGALPGPITGHFDAGQMSTTFTIDVTGDTAYEANEKFAVQLTGATGGNGTVVLGEAQTATVLITNDDTIQTVNFAPSNVSVIEGNSGTTNLVFTVQRSGSGGLVGDLTFSGTIKLYDADGNDLPGIGTTFSGTILDGQTTATITIPVVGDTVFEGNEGFGLTLTNVSNLLANTEIGQIATAIGRITNDDALTPQQDYVIHAGETFTGALTLTGNQTLTIEAGAVMDVSIDTQSVAITLTGPATGIKIENFGILKSSYNGNDGSYAIRGNFGTQQHTVTIINHEGAEIRGGNVIELSSSSVNAQNPNGYPGVVILDNAGLITGARAFETRQLRSSDEVVIYNRVTGIMTGEGSDNVRPGSSVDAQKVRVYNDGQILDRIYNGGTQPQIFGSDAVDFQSGTQGTFYNGATGLVSGSRHAITGGAPIDVYNAEGGVIIGRNGSAINLDTTLAQRVTHIENRGLMVGDAQALAYDPTISDLDGDAIDIDALASIENWGTIESRGAAGLHQGEANVSEAIAMGGGSVINHEGGQIIGYGRAIQIDNSGNGGALGAMTITNDGLIRGDGHLPTGTGVTPEDIALFAERIKGGEAINIVGTFADTVTNGVTGVITGGTKTGGGDDLFVNHGTITATGGSAVNLGEGNDTFEAHAGSTVAGLIDGGEGDDTLKLIGPGAGALGATANVETLEVQSGTWSVADGAAGFTDIIIEDGATVTSGLIVNGNDHVVVEAGGALDVAGDAITWEGFGSDGEVVIDNAGLIEADGRVLNTQVNSSGNFTFNNLEGAIVRGSFSPRQEVRPESVITINNAGLIEDNGRIFDFKELTKDGAHAVINNLAGGQIRQVGGDGEEDVMLLDDNTVVNNWGTIVSEEDSVGGGDAVNFDSGRGSSLHNYAGGLIEGSRHALTGKQDFTVVNEGTMIGRNGSAVNFDTNASELVKITNRGVMEGRSAELEDSDGDAIDVDGLVQVLNYGRIAGLGAEGYHDGEPNVSEGIAVGGGTIVNNATGEIYGYGRAIQVDDSSNGGALGASTIVNDGLIQGDGHGPEGVDPEDAARFDLRGNEAINLVGDYEDFVGNNSAGRIIGGVSMGGARDTLNNSGLIRATGGSAIDMGAGNDQVNLYVGAVVEGTILLGTGDDVALSTSAGGFVIDGGDGNDTMAMDSTYGGDDVLIGGAGNDHLYGGAGDDRIDGGLDNDTLSGERGADVIEGGDGDDMIDGGADDDMIFGDAGNDRIVGGLGNDVVKGNAGSDTFIVSSLNDGADKYDGGAGSDTIDFSATSAAINLTLAEGTTTFGSDTIVNVENVIGSSLADRLFGNSQANELRGGDGADRLEGLGGDDRLFGGLGLDVMRGGDGDDYLEGGEGTDQMDGGAGNDTLKGGADNDAITGADGNDLLDGGDGNDTLNAGAGDDEVIGGAGNDKVRGHEGNDKLDGGAGSDALEGGDGNDQLNAGEGDDYLDGGIGNDRMFGGVGVDTLLGGEGNDLLVGGAGNDKLTGGAGADQFGFNTLGDGIDTITDFTVTGANQDQIVLAAGMFQGFGGSDAFGLIGGGFLRTQVSGGQTQIQIDVDGGGNNYQTLALVNGHISNGTLADHVLVQLDPIV